MVCGVIEAEEKKQGRRKVMNGSNGAVLRGDCVLNVTGEAEEAAWKARAAERGDRKEAQTGGEKKRTRPGRRVLLNVTCS